MTDKPKFDPLFKNIGRISSPSRFFSPTVIIELPSTVDWGSWGELGQGLIRSPWPGTFLGSGPDKNDVL